MKFVYFSHLIKWLGVTSICSSNGIRFELIYFYLGLGKLCDDEMPTYVADSNSSSDSESEVWDLPLATVIHLEPNSEGAKNINMGFLSGTDLVWSGNRFANKQGAHKYIRWNCRTTNCRTANNLR